MTDRTVTQAEHDRRAAARGRPYRLDLPGVEPLYLRYLAEALQARRECYPEAEEATVTDTRTGACFAA